MKDNHRDNDLINLDAVFGSFMPLRLHMRLNHPLHNYIEENIPGIEAEATAVHEYIHFFQTLFTGYGQVTWEMHRQMTGMVFREWKEAQSNSNQKKRIPLAYFGFLGKEEFFHAFCLNATVIDMTNSSRARFWLKNPDLTLQQLGLKMMPYPWPSNPAITVKNESHILQGKEIIEGHAHFIECVYLEKIHNIDRKSVWNKSGIPKQYWIAFEWFLEQCGEERYSEFPFICDLSLQISMKPLVPQTEKEWHALNPAWRFVKLVEVLKDESSLRIGSPEQWSQTYGDFTSTLLNRCNFSSLEQVFSERLDSFKRKAELLHLEKVMETAIHFRRSNPWCCSNPIENLDLWYQMVKLFKIPILEVEGSLGSFGESDIKVNAEAVMELQFQAFAAQILGEFSSLAKQEKTIECAFSRFNIPQGCEFQKSHSCSGRYYPVDGAPFEVTESENGDLRGCSFEMFLIASGIKSTDIEIDHEAKFPTFEELENYRKGIDL